MAPAVPTSKESRVVFTCGEREFTVADVIDAAHFRGEIEPLWRESRTRCEAEARGLAGNTSLDDGVLEQAAVAFRYQHDLITAEETEAWLEARALTLEDFSAYFARVEWGNILAGREPSEITPFHGASPEQREILVIDLILSGRFDAMASRLAWRLAAEAADKTEAREADNLKEVGVEREKFRKRMGLAADGPGEWLRALDRDEMWLEEMLELEAAYQRRRLQRLTPEALQRELGSVRLPMTRFDVEVIELESRDAANEAFMCVRDDGMSMQEVAQEGRYPFRRMEVVLEQVADNLQQKFLSLTPGSVLEPTPREDGYVLTRLLEKKEPTLEQPDVRQRLEQRILERHFAELSSSRIQWRILMNGA